MGEGNATRRRYAHDLRRLCDSESVDGCVRLDAALDELGLGTCYWVPCHDVERLADLIDRPTCRVVEFERARWVGADGKTCRIVECRCSACGEEPWADADSVTRYCPCCGAEVVW